jgi:hypothetical protein
LGALMIQVGLDGAFASVCCCDSHAGILTTHYGFSIVKCSSQLFSATRKARPLRR